MSYQVLARKWRPDSFESLVGQSHIVRALTNALDSQRLHHAYLFTGTRGVGKTTLGRILAKCLNCEIGVSSKPCNVCPSCQEIGSGRFIDLIEVDAASRTKVEDTRELLENVPYAPTSGRFKVYLIDEVHMLSTHSFNALLKTLEEPPSHVKFFLATTDPQKLPITVLSRCLQFHLKCLSTEQIAKQLAYILQQEQLNFDDEALSRLAHAAEGSMRDALSLLDQAISFSEGYISTANIKAMLSTIEATHLYDIVEALARKEAHTLISITIRLAEQAADFSHVLEELLALLHQIAISQFVPEAPIAQWDNTKIQYFAKEVSAQDIQLFYQIALMGRKDLPLAPTPKMGLEMTLLRMLAFQPVSLGEPPIQQTHLPQTQLSPATKEAEGAMKPAANWSDILSGLNLSGMTAAIANNCLLEKITDDEIFLAIDPNQSVLLNKKQEERLTQALGDYFKHPMRLTIRIGRNNMATPAAQALDEQSKRKSSAYEAITQDSNVLNIIDTFNAKLVQDSVEAQEK